MTQLTLRLVKGSPLSNQEVDNNFSNLNITKTEIGGDLSGNVFTPVVSGIQGRPVANVEPAEGQVLIWSSDVWGPGQIGGIDYFVEDSNIILEYSQFSSFGSPTNLDAVFSAKGTGATLAQPPTSDTANGNPRGDYATDWQKHRASSNQVASGNYAVISGGRNNSAEGIYTVVAGGINNNAAGAYSSVAGGAENIASAQYSYAMGGYQNVSNSDYAVVIGGRKGNTRNIVGYTVFPASNIPIANESGASQAGLLVLGCETTDELLTTMTSNSASPSITNQLYPPNNSTVGVRGLVVGRMVGGTGGSIGDSRVWSFEGSIAKDSSGNLSEVGEIVIHKLPESANTLTWDIDIVSEDGTFKVKVQGESTKTIRWVCRLDTVEVTNL
jgi:hypothetical protein